MRLARYEAHPGRADENQQRHHQEERQVDARQRPLQHAQLVVVLEGLRHPPRARRQLAGQVVGRDDDAGGRAVVGAHDGAPRAADRPPRRAPRSSACRRRRRAPARPADPPRRACSRAAAPAPRRRPPARACGSDPFAGPTRYTSTICTRCSVTSGASRSRIGRTSRAREVHAAERRARCAPA